MPISDHIGGFIRPGYNPNYSGKWKLPTVMQAEGAGNWPLPPFAYGTLWMWGYNSVGQLGQGNTTNISSPAQVGALGTWSVVMTSDTATAGVASDGTLWTWGDNAQGQLGVNNTTNYSSPVQVGALADWPQEAGKIAAGTAHFVFVKSDGTLWCFGQGGYGRLGDGTDTNRSSPVQIGALTTWAKAGASKTSSFAIKTDGTLWAWGSGSQGTLGLGNTTNYSSPVQVGALTDWADASATQNKGGAAVKTDGTLWTWGWNSYGELGDGSTTNRSSPVQVGALTDWEQVSGGNHFGACLKTDGTIWVWGYNGEGQSGQGDTTNRSSPVQVGALTTWSRVTAGGGSLFAHKADGTLWVWGAGGNGQLGLGNTTNYSSPVQVGALTTWGATFGCLGRSAMGGALQR